MTTEKKKRTPKPARNQNLEMMFLSVAMAIFEGVSSDVPDDRNEIFRRFIRNYYRLKALSDHRQRAIALNEFQRDASFLAEMAEPVRYRLSMNDDLDAAPYFDFSLDREDQSDTDCLIAHSLLRVFSGREPIGPHYIGACPRCGKIFEKKQANAVFCGVQCAGAERAARWRKK